MMKLREIITIACLVLTHALGAQSHTMVLKGPNESADSWLYDRANRRDSNHGAGPTLLVNNWTGGGSLMHVSSLLRFDLSQLPDNAEILRAELSLFYAPKTTHGYGNGHYGRNTDFKIRRVTTPWDENTLTFNSKPNSTQNGEVLVVGHRTSNQDFTNLKVTELVTSMAKNANHGFQLEFVSKQRYSLLVWASSEHPNPELHPELKITYSVPPVDAEAIGPFLLNPQPSTSHRSLNLSDIPEGDLRYNIINIQGNRFVPPTPLPSRERTKLNVDFLPHGTYLLTLTLNGEFYATNKFVVRRRVVMP